jgi:16S rRNA processing protein RimM
MPDKYIGTIINTHGYKGSMIVVDIPAGINILQKGTQVAVGYSAQFNNSYTIKEWKNSKNGAIVTFDEITSKEEARILKEMGIFISDEIIAEQEVDILPQDEIMNFNVFDSENGEEIGQIVDILILPANDVWIVKTKSGELPVPVIDEVVQDINFEKQRINIKIIPGLFDLLIKKEQ